MARLTEKEKKAREYAAKYREENREKLKEQQREYARKRRKDPEVRKHRNTLARASRLAYYGITPEEYDEILKRQGGVCAICEREPASRSLDVDHEHQIKEKTRSPETRKRRIRGLLCHRCNRALGLFGNDLNTLLLVTDNAAKYIEQYWIRFYSDDETLVDKLNNTIEYLKKNKTPK